MLDISYGYEHEDIIKSLCDMADRSRNDLNSPTITGFSRAAIRQDIYDELFLSTPLDPWSTIMVNPRERYAGTHLWRSRVSEFMVNGVYEKTGLNMTEFLKLPTYMVEYILDILRQTSKDTLKGASELEEELANTSKEFSNMKKR